MILKNKKNTLTGVWLALFMILLVACNSANISSGQTNPTSGPSGSATDYPAIDAGSCKLVLQSAQVSDRYPPGCVSGSKNCLQMNSGEELLLVSFKPIGSCNLESLADEVAFEKDLYLLAIDGTRSERLVTGVDGGVFTLGFSLASSPDNLLLVWGKNPKLKLPKINP
jgi:hypothetical protein